MLESIYIAVWDALKLRDIVETALLIYMLSLYGFECIIL